MSTIQANRVNRTRRNMRKGVAVLNRMVPGWFNQINCSQLDMCSSRTCVTGLLGISDQKDGDSDTPLCYRFDLGFDCQNERDTLSLDELRMEWTKEVERLQAEERNELFGKVVDGIIGQGCKVSVDEEGTCLYRGPNNTKCAAGQIIPDSEYKPEFEKNTVTMLHYFTEKYSRRTLSFLMRAQNAHDDKLRFEGKASWAKNMLEVANEFGIDAPIAKAKLETIVAIG